LVLTFAEVLAAEASNVRTGTLAEKVPQSLHLWRCARRWRWQRRVGPSTQFQTSRRPPPRN